MSLSFRPCDRTFYPSSVISKTFLRSSNTDRVLEMPPKKAAAKQSKTETNGTSAKPESHPQAEKPIETKDEGAKPQQNSANSGSKRKQPATKDEPKKASRRSGRGVAKAGLDPAQLISFLLSQKATDICRPKHEQGVDASDVTYTSDVPMSPFEELLCAVILSRPISHSLGQRSIRTLLNKPYEFRSPKQIKAAGSEKVHEALENARTQHKAKTAEQIVMLADIVSEKYADKDDDTSLEPLRKEAEYDQDVLRETLTKGIKGMGRTSVDIFQRRIQGVWKECYPFIDARTRSSVEKLGLDSDPIGLRNQINDVWGEINLGEIKVRGAAEKERMVFVRILERAIGADLEGKTDELLEEASKAS